jgi:FKBP-type peptidyl-prolyl cis-trans isomerase 2
MSQAKVGDTVRVHYTGKLKDGSVFDSSRQRDPLELTLGAGRVIPGFEQGIEGMQPGESKSIDVPASEAYGQRFDERIVDFEREKLPEGVEPQVGQQIQLQTQQGQPVPAVVTEVSDAKITVDANHPLAGRDLVFDVELVEIV